MTAKYKTPPQKDPPKCQGAEMETSRMYRGVCFPCPGGTVASLYSWVFLVVLGLSVAFDGSDGTGEMASKVQGERKWPGTVSGPFHLSGGKGLQWKHHMKGSRCPQMKLPALPGPGVSTRLLRLTPCSRQPPGSDAGGPTCTPHPSPCDRPNCRSKAEP